MSCEPMVELMQRDLDHDLSPTEKMILQAHLVECPECAGLNERLQLLSLGLEQLPKVKPAFSIVDSILPRLEALPVEPAAAPAMADELAERREKKRWFSWRAASGAVAAALVIGAFIFQAGNGGFSSKSNQVADSGMKDQRISATAEAAPVPSVALEGVQEGAVTFTVSNTDIAAHAEDQYNKSMDSGDTPVENEGYAVQPKAAARSGDNPSDAPSAASGGGESPSFGGAAGGQQEVSGGSVGGSELGITAIVEPTGTSGTDNSVNESDSQSLKGFAPAPAAEPAPRIQAVASPGGIYTARLHETNAVQIVNQNLESVFLSSVKLEPGDMLIFDGWSGDTVFTYRIQTSSGEEATYRVDITTLQEMKSS